MKLGYHSFKGINASYLRDASCCWVMFENNVLCHLIAEELDT